MKKDQEEVLSYVEAKKGLERDYLREIITSRQSAWRVAGVMSVIAVLSVGAVCGLTPLKETLPYILKVDSTNGSVESLTLVNSDQVSMGDAVDSYWLGQYIQARESYSDKRIQEYYDRTMAFSDSTAASDYDQLFVGDEAIDKKLRDSVEISAQPTAVFFNQNTGKDADRIATVRFKKEIKQSNDKSSRSAPFVATVSFRYVTKIMKSSDRFVNPLGFVVTSYKSQPEVIQ